MKRPLQCISEKLASKVPYAGILHGNNDSEFISFSRVMYVIDFNKNSVLFGQGCYILR